MNPSLIYKTEFIYAKKPGFKTPKPNIIFYPDCADGPLKMDDDAAWCANMRDKQGRATFERINLYENNRLILTIRP
jgi:hypothetical protein